MRKQVSHRGSHPSAPGGGSDVVGVDTGWRRHCYATAFVSFRKISCAICVHIQQHALLIITGASHPHRRHNGHIAFISLLFHLKFNTQSRRWQPGQYRSNYRPFTTVDGTLTLLKWRKKSIFRKNCQIVIDFGTLALVKWRKKSNLVGDERILHLLTCNEAIIADFGRLTIHWR